MESANGEVRNYFIKIGHTLQRVSAKEIKWIKSEGNYCIIHTTSKKFVVKISLARLKEKLPHYFLQVHRSFIIQLDLIENIDLSAGIIHLQGEEIPIGRRFKDQLMEHLTLL